MEVWKDFGQKIDLATRIREILYDYPAGTSVLKELLQVCEFYALFVQCRAGNVPPSRSKAAPSASGCLVPVGGNRIRQYWTLYALVAECRRCWGHHHQVLPGCSPTWDRSLQATPDFLQQSRDVGG